MIMTISCNEFLDSRSVEGSGICWVHG